MGKEGTWIKDLCEKCSVSIKLHQDGGIRCVRRDEVICVDFIKFSIAYFLKRISEENSLVLLMLLLSSLEDLKNLKVYKNLKVLILLNS